MVPSHGVASESSYIKLPSFPLHFTSINYMRVRSLLLLYVSSSPLKGLCRFFQNPVIIIYYYLCQVLLHFLVFNVEFSFIKSCKIQVYSLWTIIFISTERRWGWRKAVVVCKNCSESVICRGVYSPVDLDTYTVCQFMPQIHSCWPITYEIGSDMFCILMQIKMSNT